MGDRPEVGRLVRASADGDEAAWNALVRRFAHPVMAMIRSYRLTPADAEDVYQTVWLKLVENLDSLRDPEALPGWLRSTTMHECLRQLERRRRTVPVDPQSDEATKQPSADDIEAAAMRAELRVALRDGLAELSEVRPRGVVQEHLRATTDETGPYWAHSWAQPGTAAADSCPAQVPGHPASRRASEGR